MAGVVGHTQVGLFCCCVGHAMQHKRVRACIVCVGVMTKSRDEC